MSSGSSRAGQAEAVGADLAVFPELILTGYPPEDLLVEPGFVAGNLRGAREGCEATERCAAVVGYVEEDGDLYNAAAVCAGGRCTGSWRKQLLPNYGVFDERRYFAPGQGVGPALRRRRRACGVTVCEDGWSPTGPIGSSRPPAPSSSSPCNASPYRAVLLAKRERDALDAAPRRIVPARLRQSRRRPGRARLRRRLDGVRPRRQPRRSAPQFAEGVTVVRRLIRPAFRKRLLDPRGRDGWRRCRWRGQRGASAGSDAARRRARRRSPRGSARPRRSTRPSCTATSDYVVKNGFADVLVGLCRGASILARGDDRRRRRRSGGRVHGVLMPSRLLLRRVRSTTPRRSATNLGIEHHDDPNRAGPPCAPRAARAGVRRSRGRAHRGEHSEPASEA